MLSHREPTPHPRRTRRTAATAISTAAALLLVLLSLAGCGQLTGDLGGVATPPPSEQPSIDLPSSEPTPGATPAVSGIPTPTGTPAGPFSTPTAPIGTTTVRVYYFLGSFTDNAGLVPVLREVPKTEAVGAAALRALIDGPNDAELGASPAMYTTIPEGTIVLGLRIDAGIATVNLSREFEQDGSVSATHRLAQVVYTLTQFPTVHGVRFELDGAPVTTFGSEGINLKDPVDRATYTDALPAIFVDRPAWGGVIGNPARLVGQANVFEATFRARLLDADGHFLASGVVTATCGTGCWGSFDVTLSYKVASAGWGTLEVYDLSAKDGSVENRTAYPVWLTP